MEKHHTGLSHEDWLRLKHRQMQLQKQSSREIMNVLSQQKNVKSGPSFEDWLSSKRQQWIKERRSSKSIIFNENHEEENRIHFEAWLAKKEESERKNKSDMLKRRESQKMLKIEKQQHDFENKKAMENFMAKKMMEIEADSERKKAELEKQKQQFIDKLKGRTEQSQLMQKKYLRIFK